MLTGGAAILFVLFSLCTAIMSQEVMWVAKTLVTIFSSPTIELIKICERIKHGIPPDALFPQSPVGKNMAYTLARVFYRIYILRNYVSLRHIFLNPPTLYFQVYTDRSRVVLSALCRVVGCAGLSDGALAGPVERWAQLALKRYEAVSDSDLLLVYIPLLHTCISIWLVNHLYYCIHT